jgi:hypothetical protein
MKTQFFYLPSSIFDENLRSVLAEEWETTEQKSPYFHILNSADDLEEINQLMS